MTALEARKVAELIASGRTNGFLVTEHPTDIDVLVFHVKTVSDDWPRYVIRRDEFFHIIHLLNILVGGPVDEDAVGDEGAGEMEVDDEE